MPGLGDGIRDDVPERLEEGPTEEERAAWARVRRSATGMRHHAAKVALDTARKAVRDGSLNATDALIAQAEAEEWERVTETLADHAGTYDPAADPFVQGELTGRAHHPQTPPHDRRTCPAH